MLIILQRELFLSSFRRQGGAMVSEPDLKSEGWGFKSTCMANVPSWCDSGVSLCSPVLIGDGHQRKCQRNSENTLGQIEMVKQNVKCHMYTERK